MTDYFEERGVGAETDADREAILQGHIMRLLADFNMFVEMGVANQVAPPASKSVVKDLPDEKIEEKGGQCQVCLKEYEEGEVVKKMPCKHTFHSECLLAWLRKTNSCPLCRHELPTDDQFYEEYRREKRRVKEREADLENLHSSMFT